MNLSAFKLMQTVTVQKRDLQNSRGDLDWSIYNFLEINDSYS